MPDTDGAWPGDAGGEAEAALRSALQRAGIALPPEWLPGAVAEFRALGARIAAVRAAVAEERRDPG